MPDKFEKRQSGRIVPPQPDRIDKVLEASAELIIEAGQGGLTPNEVGYYCQGMLRQIGGLQLMVIAEQLKIDDLQSAAAKRISDMVSDVYEAAAILIRDSMAQRLKAEFGFDGEPVGKGPR